MFDLLSLSVASLNDYFVIQIQLSVNLYITETLLPLDTNIIIMNNSLVIILRTVRIKFKNVDFLPQYQQFVFLTTRALRQFSTGRGHFSRIAGGLNLGVAMSTNLAN